MAGLELHYFNYAAHNVYLTGDVGENMYTTLTEKLDKIREEDNDVIINNFSVLQSVGIEVSIGRPPINIYLNTFGGGIYDMFSIYDTIKALEKEYVVNLYCQGKVMSAGTIIMLAVDVKHRFAHKNCTFMFHDLSSCSLGKLKDIEEDVDECKRLHKRLWDIYRENTKLPVDKLKDMYEKKKDIFFDAAQAKKYGIISTILE